MRFSFRRAPKGRHALGAAVTAIPSAPVRVPVPVGALAPSVPVDPPRTDVNAVVVPDVPSPQPVQPVQAVVEPVPVPAVPAPEPVEPVTAPAAPLPSLPVQPVDLEPALLDLLGSFDVAPPQVLPTVAPAPTASAPPARVVTVEPTVAPVAPAAPTAPPAAVVPVVRTTPVPTPSAPTGPRVELGFADGSVRRLDPSSVAAQELSDLVAELTSKDGNVSR